MNHRTAVVLTTVFVALAFFVLPLSAQDKPGSAAMDAMMKTMMAAMTPGEQHKALAACEGIWDAEVKSWMAPDAPPTVSKGSATMKMVLGGRYLYQEMSGEMMGMPFQGMGYTGYDNINKKYVSFWIDNMGTGMASMDGAMNKGGDVLTLYGKMDEPTTGEHGKNVKYVTRLISKDKQIFEAHDLSIAEPHTKVLEVVYTRHK